jgi:lipopolysaccharide export system permease protein
MNTLLWRYIFKQSVWSLLAMLGIIITIIMTAEVLELMRRYSDDPHKTFASIFMLASLKLPLTLDKILPFSLLIATIVTLTRLNKRQELIVVRSMGVSVWTILLPLLVLALCVAIFRVCILNPLVASTIKHYDSIDTIGQRTNNGTDNGVWLRQKDRDGHSIIHGTLTGDTTLSKVTIFRFGANKQFYERFDAHTAFLYQGFWLLPKTIRSIAGERAKNFTNHRIPTSLTQQDIWSLMTEPSTLPFLKLLTYTKHLDKAGFSVTRYKQHFYSLIASPILYIAVVVMAAIFCFRQKQRTYIWWLIIATIASGFLLYFTNNLITALGMAGRLPTFLAAFSLPLCIILMGITWLLYAEEG